MAAGKAATRNLTHFIIATGMSSDSDEAHWVSHHEPICQLSRGLAAIVEPFHLIISACQDVYPGDDQ